MVDITLQITAIHNILVHNVILSGKKAALIVDFGKYLDFLKDRKQTRVSMNKPETADNNTIITISK